MAVNAVSLSLAMQQCFSLGVDTEGTLRRQFYLDGARHGILQFGLLREEFFAGRYA